MEGFLRSLHFGTRDDASYVAEILDMQEAIWVFYSLHEVPWTNSPYARHAVVP